MTATAAPAITTDTWDLRTMREAKAYRDANPDPRFAAADRALDARLAACEAAAAAVGTSTERPTADEAPAPRGNGNGSSNYTGQAATGASEPQQRFIASLARDLGWTDHATKVALDACKTKAAASKLIDAMKAEVTKARREGTAPARPERKATERQVEFLSDLLNERAHDLGELDPAELSFARASELIGQLMNAPRAAVAAHGIREGRYAYTADGGATADHYRVRRDGKIVVWTAGGEWPYTGKGLNEALTWIKANPREAAELFGQLTESCGRCGRDLSDDDSRARGLGPICAGKTDW